MAWSIRAVKRIDITRLAVTDLQSDARFRVVGGIYSAVTPYRGMLSISIDRQLASTSRTRWSGHEVRSQIGPARSQRCPTRSSSVSRTAGSANSPPSWNALHVEHLKQSILWGPPTWQHAHDDALERFILDAALGTASSPSSP